MVSGPAFGPLGFSICLDFTGLGAAMQLLGSLDLNRE
jgi:hypothetical protein